MDFQDVAAKILTFVGDADNVERVMICLTRLRITVKNTESVCFDELRNTQGVLGVVGRKQNVIEVVFGPTAEIESIANEFANLSHVDLDTLDIPSHTTLEPIKLESVIDSDSRAALENIVAANKEPGYKISAGRKQSYRAQQQAAINDGRLVPEDIDALKAFLNDRDEKPKHMHLKQGKSVLVINGPNINMLGTREPNLYGRDDYAALLRICKAAAVEAGFSDIRCFQSNHEGALVDEIQSALGVYDGIVINPAAYTHTSIAILDAVKAVALPCVEIHISKVEEREDFRQVSYVRQACFETITGLGLEGYRKAILDLAKELGM